MVSRFSIIGVVAHIHAPHISKAGSESIALTLDVSGESFYVLLTGKLKELVGDEQIRIGDKVFVEGKLRKDRALTADCPKSICVLFVSFLSIL